MSTRILISACLLGVSCRYDGQSKPVPAICQLQKHAELIPVCPEQLGGLPTPRPASERNGEQVINNRGVDVTAQYRRGAEQALALAQMLHCDYAILKERSPSCGSGVIYDGSFAGTLIPGDGVTAQLLKARGITVYGESAIPQLLQQLNKE